MINESTLNAVADKILFLIQAMQQPITKPQETALNSLKESIKTVFASIEGLEIKSNEPADEVPLGKLFENQKDQIVKIIDEKIKDINNTVSDIDEEHDTLLERIENAEKAFKSVQEEIKTLREEMKKMREDNDLLRETVRVLCEDEKAEPVIVKIFKGKETLKGVNGEVEVEYSDVKLPTKKHDNDAGYDGYVCFPDGFPLEVTIQPGETKQIPLGICYEIPDGYEIQLRPRSGNTSDRIHVGLGTLDAGYRGIIKANVSNDSNEPYTVKQHDRICQLVVSKVEYSEMIFAEDNEVIGTTERGTGGFGSTGR